MILKLHGLGKTPQKTNLFCSPNEISLPAEKFQRVVKVELILQDIGYIIKADVALTTISRQSCDRCAGEFDMNHDVRHRMNFIPIVGEKFSNEDDSKYFYPDRPMVDIGDDVRDLLLMSVPPKILCSDDCKGLCQKCGADLNREVCECAEETGDSRWAKLADLKKEVTDK